jgi:hypothetical protein
MSAVSSSSRGRAGLKAEGNTPLDLMFFQDFLREGHA